MSSIKIGFSKSSTILSMMIRFFTRSDISHTWIFLPDVIGGIDLVMESVPGGFHIITYERFVKENTVIKIVDLNIAYSERSLTQAFGWMGKRYDYVTVFGMSLVLFGRCFGQTWKNPLRTRALNCVESIVYFLRSNDVRGTRDIDPGSMTPHDLYEFLKR